MIRLFCFTLLAFALAGCGPHGPASVHVDPVLLTLIPTDTVMLAGMKLDAARKTPTYERMNAALHLDAPLEEIAKQTGFDPRAELWEVLLASDGKESLVFARGKFSPHGIEPEFKKEGVTKTPYKGYTLIGNQDFALTFVNSTVAAAGKPAAVRKVIDGRDSGTGPTPAMLARINTIPPGNQFWAVTTSAQTYLPRDMEAPKLGGVLGGFAGNIPKILAMVESGDAAVDISSGVKLVIHASCTSEENAKQLNGFVRGVIGMGRLQAGQELLPIFDGFGTSINHKTASLTLTLAGGEWERLLELAETMRGKAAPSVKGKDGVRP